MYWHLTEHLIFALYTWLSCYSNTERSTQKPLLSVGPMMLLSDNKYSTYFNFSLALWMLHWTALNFAPVNSGNIATGSDDENDLVNAAMTAFPTCLQLYRTVHVEDNVLHKLTTIGMSTSCCTERTDFRSWRHCVSSVWLLWFCRGN